MTSRHFGFALSVSLSEPLKKKRVLLLIRLAYKRELRAEIMRKLGIDVDCAADITGGPFLVESRFVRSGSDQHSEQAGHARQVLRRYPRAAPRQRFAFLVGKPEYLRIRRVRRLC